MPYTTLFFDLDNTLYPDSSGLWNVIRDRMNGYMLERLGLPEDQIPILRRRYSETYGTTLRGLQKHHKVNVDDFLAYVHDIPLKHYLHPEPGVRSLLFSLPQPKWIFTNADQAHATRVLNVLGLAGCFTGIIDIRALQFACKPELEAYQQALALAGAAHPQECVLFDDSPLNLAPAYQMGMTTVLVGGACGHPAVHYQVRSILDVPAALPQLWPAGTLEA